MNTLISLLLICCRVFFGLAYGTPIVSPSGIHALTFYECNSTEKSVIDTAWTDSLEMVKSIRKIDPNRFSTIDWWGPPVLSHVYIDQVQSNYTAIQQYLSRPNSTTLVNIFCGDPPSKKSCNNFADPGLVLRDASAGFYSYAYTGDVDPSDQTLNIVFCDALFALPSLGMHISEVAPHPGFNHLDSYWFDQGKCHKVHIATAYPALE